MNYTNRRNSQNNKVMKTFKDYLVPIVVVGVVLLLIINNLFSSDSTQTPNPSASALEVSLGVPDTEAYVVYSGGNKTKLEGKVQMYQTEKLQVVNGNLAIKDGANQLTLNKLGEFRYNEDGSYTLYSSDLWVQTASGMNIEMRYAKVTANAQSIFNLSQNEVASTIYVVSGVVNVQNLAGKSASLQKGEKLVIMRNNANDETSDLSLTKEQIDDYIKTDDWFIKNNGAQSLSLALASDTGATLNNTGSLSLSGTSSTGNTLSGGFDQTFQSYISFTNLYDEMQANSASLDVNGNILADGVYKIEINGKEATIDQTAKTFSIKGIKLSQKTNDLVYRVYDDGAKLLYKGVVTVYSTSATESTNTNSSLAQVENYPISSSPFYQILAPKQNPYTTTDDVVRIEGTVPTKTVEKIVINDFELKKFPAYGSYWSYFANSDFGNLKEGVNIYKIQYFGAEGKLIYENNFTIIKQPKEVPTSTGTLQTPSDLSLSGSTAQ